MIELEQACLRLKELVKLEAVSRGQSKHFSFLNKLLDTEIQDGFSDLSSLNRVILKHYDKVCPRYTDSCSGTKIIPSPLLKQQLQRG